MPGCLKSPLARYPGQKPDISWNGLSGIMYGGLCWGSDFFHQRYFFFAFSWCRNRPVVWLLMDGKQKLAICCVVSMVKKSLSQCWYRSVIRIAHVLTPVTISSFFCLFFLYK